MIDAGKLVIVPPVVPIYRRREAGHWWRLSTPARPAPGNSVIVLPGNVPRFPRLARAARACRSTPASVPTIDGGQGQRRGSWSSFTWPPRWNRRCRPSMTAGKLVIVHLAACRGPHGSHVSPCPWCRRSTAGKASAGKAGHRATVPAVPTIDAGKCADDRRREADAGVWQRADDRRRARPAPGKLVIVPRSPRLARVAVPVDRQPGS